MVTPAAWLGVIGLFVGPVLASSAQFQFHAGLVDATARGGNAVGARMRYEQATAIFTPERVLHCEARCLAPVDRYPLARMSRIAARLYGQAGDETRQQTAAEQARILAQPDRRGICVTGGRPGQESPEAVADSFWHALADGGWPQAERFLAPGLRGSPLELPGALRNGDSRHHRAQVTWIAGLQGNERQVSFRYQVEIESSSGRRFAGCANSEARLVGDGWYLIKLPIFEEEPCRP